MRLCACGCGEPAPISRRSDVRTGAVRGQAARFRRGHNARLQPLRRTPTKRCWVCQQWKARTAAEFYSDRGQPDGLSSKCKPCARARNDQWKRDHPDQWRAAQRTWRSLHPEKRDYVRAWVAQNRERVKALLAAWRSRFPQRSRAYARRWRAEHPEQHRALMQAAKHRRRARALTAVTLPIDYAEVFRLAGGICGICGKPVERRAVGWDHIVPLSKGGANTPDNIQPCHPRCNSIKGDRSLAWAMAYVAMLQEVHGPDVTRPKAVSVKRHPTPTRGDR